MQRLDIWVLSFPHHAGEKLNQGLSSSSSPSQTTYPESLLELCSEVNIHNDVRRSNLGTNFWVFLTEEIISRVYYICGRMLLAS